MMAMFLLFIVLGQALNMLSIEDVMDCEAAVSAGAQRLIIHRNEMLLKIVMLVCATVCFISLIGMVLLGESTLLPVLKILASNRSAWNAASPNTILSKTSMHVNKKQCQALIYTFVNGDSNQHIKVHDIPTIQYCLTKLKKKKNRHYLYFHNNLLNEDSSCYAGNKFDDNNNNGVLSGAEFIRYKHYCLQQ